MDAEWRERSGAIRVDHAVLRKIMNITCLIENTKAAPERAALYVCLVLAEFQRLVDVDALDDSAEYREAAKQHYRYDDIHLYVVAAFTHTENCGFPSSSKLMS